MKNIRLIILPVLLSVIIAACDSDRQNATLNNSKDTSNVKGAAVTPAFPTDTPKKGTDTSARGNADPSGSIQKSNK